MFLSRWRHPTNQQVVGLDISADFIKLLKINSSEDVKKVEIFAIEPVPAGIIVKNEIKDAAALSNLIKTALGDTNANTTNVAIAIPRSAVIVKNIMIDGRLSPDEIESRAWIEANRHFPELVGNIYLDFTLLAASDQNTQQRELMLIACRKDQVDPYLDVLRNASLNVKIVDVNSYALERALEVMTQQFKEVETIAFLNLDFQLSTLIVIHQGEMIYAHDQTFDGRRLLSQIEASEKKKMEAIEQPITDDMVIQPSSELESLKENLSSHLRHTMHFFYSSRPHINIQKIIIGGDCSNIKNLCRFVHQEIGAETTLAEPFNTMTIDPGINQEKLKQYAPALMLSCGLALSKI